MKRALRIFSLILLLGLFITGCTQKDKEPENTQEKSKGPVIEYEMPDKAKDYDFDITFSIKYGDMTSLVRKRR